MTTAVLRTLAVRLRMNSAAFRKDVDKVDARFKKMTSNMRRSANQFQNTIGQLGVSIASGFGMAAVANAADEMTNLRNKLNAVYDSSTDVANGMLDIKRIARESRTELSAVGTLYQRLTMSTKNLKTSQEDIAAVTQVVANTFLLSGTTASEAANSSRQLAQGLASGALRGDEFRSVSENNVALTNMLAEGFGLTVGQLRLFSATGGITAEKIIPMLTARLEDTNEAVSNMDVTLGQAKVMFKNAFTEMIDRVNTAFGVTNSLAVVIKTLSENIHTITLTAAGLATILLTQVVRGFVSWIALSLLAIPLTGVKMVAALASFGMAAASVALTALPALVAGVVALSTAILSSPITWIVLGIMWLGSMLVTLQEKFAIFENSLVVFDKLRKVAGAAMDHLKLAFQAALLDGEIFFAGIREALAGVLKTLGADKLAEAVMPDEDVAALEKKLGGIAAQAEEAGERMKAALAEPLEFVSGDDGYSPIDGIKAKFAEMMSSLGGGDEAGSGGLMGGIVDKFSTGIDSVMTSIAEANPTLARFFGLLNGTIDPDKENAKDGEEKEEQVLPWAQRFADAVAVAKAAMKSMSDSAKAEVTTMIERYDTFEKVFAKGVMNMKKNAAVRRAIMLKEAIIAGKSAIMKAWNSATFPANLPAVAITTASVGMTIRDIMKGQAHDGMDSLPSTGTYMLERGERVVSSRANRDLTQFLANNGQASKMRGPESVTLQVNGVADPDLVVNALASRRGELEAMIRSISAENVRLAPF